MADNKGETAGAAQGSGGGDPFGGVVLPGNEGGDGAVESAESVETAPVEGEAEAGEEVGGEGEKDPVAEATEEGDEPTTTEEAAPKVYAGQYKSPEELEAAFEKNAIALKHSSAEGKRLYSQVKEMEQGFAKRESELLDKISELEIRAEVGPDPKELTEEELEKLGPVKAALALQKQSERKAALAQLKAKAEATAKERKAQEAAVHAAIEEQMDRMEADAESFPDYVALKPSIVSMMKRVPFVTGHRESPMALYLMSFGLRALQQRAEAAKKAKGSEVAVKAKAKAAAVGAGATGAGGGTATPPVKPVKAPKAGSDEDANARLESAYAKRNFSF